MTKDIETYLSQGCGRCSLGGTPDCKVHTWHKEIAALRSILLSCNIIETVKWGSPVYTYKGKNIIMLGVFKDSCIISFLKGTLLNDEQKLLESPGENSQSTKWIKYTDVKHIIKQTVKIKEYIYETIAIEDAGLKVTFKKTTIDDMPTILADYLDGDNEYKKAFLALTQGRQRSYFLHINQAKQEATQLSRVAKCKTKVMLGKGFNEY